MEKLLEMMNLRAEKLKEMKDLNASNPTMDEVTETKYNALNNEVKTLSRNIDIANAENALRNQVDPVITDDKKDIKEDTSMKALLAYARTGKIDPQNAVTIGGTANGAVLIPEQYANAILSELPKLVAMRKFATVVKTSGTFNMPIGGATPVFGWVDENTDYPTPDLSFTNKTLEAFKSGGIITVSEELLADESFKLEVHLREKISEGIALAENVAFISGDGVKKPKGISKDITLIETVSALDTITITDVEDTYLKVPASARKQGSWIISDKFYQAIFRMKDSTGNYILRDGSNGLPSTILGRPFEIDETMAGATGEPLAIFGKISDYNIGDRGEMAIQRLDEKYADKGLIGFKVYKRTDGKLAIAKNVAMLKNA